MLFRSAEQRAAAPAPAAQPARAPQAEAPAPAAEAPAPQAEAPAPKAAAPAPAAEAAPAKPAAPQAAAPAQKAPAPQAEAPAAKAAPVAQDGGGVKGKDIAIGTPVLATDGAKIGVVNRVGLDASGAVTEIHVAPGGVAGLGVPVIAVPGNGIASIGKDVKLSLTAEDAKKLQVIDGKKG